MILPLGNQKAVVLQILADHKPAAAVSPAADAQTPALAEGIVHQAVMAAHYLAFRRDHVAGLRRQVFRQKLLEVPFPDEAHTGGVLLFADRQAAVLRDLPHLCLGHAAHGEDRFFQLFRVHHI